MVTEAIIVSIKPTEAMQKIEEGRDPRRMLSAEQRDIMNAERESNIIKRVVEIRTALQEVPKLNVDVHLTIEKLVGAQMIIIEVPLRFADTVKQRIALLDCIEGDPR